MWLLKDSQHLLGHCRLKSWTSVLIYLIQAHCDVELYSNFGWCTWHLVKSRNGLQTSMGCTAETPQGTVEMFPAWYGVHTEKCHTVYYCSLTKPDHMVWRVPPAGFAAGGVIRQPYIATCCTTFKVVRSLYCTHYTTVRLVMYPLNDNRGQQWVPH